MYRSLISIIILCVFWGSYASSNASFLDSISIPGAKCIISIPIDSNSYYVSFNHPCSNYFFFNFNFKESWEVDTLQLSCDLINNYNYNNSTWLLIDTSDEISINWQPPAPAVKRLANTIMSYKSSGDLLRIMLKSQSDSSEVYLSHTILHYAKIKTSPLPSKTTNKTNFISKAYTMNGALIQSNHRLPALYILRDNTTAQPTVHFIH